MTWPFENDTGFITKKLASRSFRANKMRNMIAVIAIVLTTILFTGLFTLGIGVKESTQKANMILSGGAGHARLINMSEIEYDTIREHPQIQSLMDEKIESFIAQGYSRSDAATEALKWVSAVGRSEHQTGLAIDINADGINSTGEQVYDWLADNAWEYGFILRYPEDKTEITHTSYEPWHYRYVGTEAAKVIFEQRICLEEYIEKLNQNNYGGVVHTAPLFLFP